MNKLDRITPEDRAFRQDFDKLFRGNVAKGGAPAAAVPQDVVLASIAAKVRTLRDSLSKSAESARKSESLSKRHARTADPLSHLFASHVAIADKILDGIAAINRNAGMVARAQVDAGKLLAAVNRTLN